MPACNVIITATWTPIATPTPTPTPTLIVTITTDANTYIQGYIIALQMTSNGTPTGKLSLYDPNGTLRTTVILNIAYWIPTGSDSYEYRPNYLGNGPPGVLIQLAPDALIGTWFWYAEFDHANKQTTYNGSFSVLPQTGTPTPSTPIPTTTLPPTTPTYSPHTPNNVITPPTSSPNNNSNMWLWITVGITILAVGLIGTLMLKHKKSSTT